MSDARGEWLADFAEQPLGTILYVGAGKGQLLPALLTSRAAQIVLVEPVPKYSTDLLKRAESESRVTVLPVAVAEKKGHGILRHFNKESLNSLRAPTELITVYPGLRETAQSEVETVSVDGLLDHISPPGTAPDCLILDAPGEEGPILERLVSSGQVLRFQNIFLRAGRCAFYQGAATLEEITHCLEDQGYRTKHLYENDPDFPELHVCLDPLALDNTRLRAELDVVQDNKTNLEQALVRALTEVDIKTEENAHATETAKAEIAQVTSALEQAQERNTKLEQDLAENQRRVELCLRDLRRAEGQIDLVTDLLIRGDAL